MSGSGGTPMRRDFGGHDDGAGAVVEVYSGVNDPSTVVVVRTDADGDYDQMGFSLAEAAEVRDALDRFVRSRADQPDTSGPAAAVLR